MQPGPTTDLDRTRRSYDEVPYDSAPMIRSHPSRIAAQAMWRGLSAPDAARARVLEIGCATGGNLLPMAAQLPQARLLGVDLSPVQIAAGEVRRKLYGLANVELRADSFEALSEADGEFDYIVCHGVYSWIPDPLRDSLLRVIRERLAPDGIAMVSFNVLPGWRLQQAVRDAMLLHAGHIEDPKQRAEQARELFEQLAESTDDAFTYGKVWRLEAQRMLAGGDAYIAHEIFEEHNNPETFAHFHARAGRFGLDFLSESSLAGSSVADLMPKAPEAILPRVAGDRLRRETYIDIFSGRSFREALLVRRGRADALAPTPQNLETLHFIPGLEVKLESSPQGGMALTLKQFSLAVDPALEPAVERFMARSPASSRVADLVPGGEPQVREALVRLLSQTSDLGLVSISTLPVICATSMPERPRLWPLAAIDCVDSPVSTTLRHSPFRFAQLQRLIGPLADGTRTPEEIVAELLEMEAKGVFRIGGPEGAVTDREAMRAQLNGPVGTALGGFLRAGLLTTG